MTNDSTKILLYCHPQFDERFLPVPGIKTRAWWEDNDKTRHHAGFCHPMVMANSLGLYIPSPATFQVSLGDDPNTTASVMVEECAPHAAITARAAFGSFEVDLGFVPMTETAGDFIYIKGIPNQRDFPFDCMEAIIEAWWNPARFSLVFLLRRPGVFHVRAGEPLAQMLLYSAPEKTSVLVRRNFPPEYDAWQTRRFRATYNRDLDYLRGRHPDGTPEPSHVASWPRIEWIRE